MIKIAVMGYGTIGSGVVEVVEKNQKILKKEIGDGVMVKKILDIRSFPGTPIQDLVVHDFSEIENDDEISVVVETMGGTKPAYEFVKGCLLKGKHVVTSNKALVAAHGTELLEIAREKDVNFFFEASVGGGIPCIRTLAQGYAGQFITEITGILNGTTNYILTRMESQGSEFADALAEAQAYGYAERDPSADIEGHDTARKIAILASLMTDSEVHFEDIYTEGITKIEKTDFVYARELGADIKLFGSAFRQDGRLFAYVAPVLVKPEDPLYAVRDVFNGIVVKGNMLGTTMLYGSGAGKLPTASAIIADIIEIGKNFRKNVPFGWHRGVTKPEPMEYTTHRFLVRFSGRAQEDIDRVKRAFGTVQVIMPEGLDEFAILTGYMREKDYLTVSFGLPNVIQMIRAEL